MDASPITLPAPAQPVRRTPVPIVAALVPVAAGVMLWLISGSLYALCFAVLGPVMIVASLIDGARGRRRARGAHAAETQVAWERAEQELIRRQRAARAALWHRYPDAAACLALPPLRGALPPDAQTSIVIGRGTVPSGIRNAGGEGDAARSFEERCAELADAPVQVALGSEICIRGPRPIAAAVARALIVQLCFRFGPRQLAIVCGNLADEFGVPSSLPHGARARPGAFRIGLASEDQPQSDTDAVIRLLPAGAAVPDGVSTVIDVIDPAMATVRTADGVLQVAPEALSRAQLAIIAAEQMTHGEDVDEVPSTVTLGELRAGEDGDGLAAAIGSGACGETIVDIVGDGPHAIVTGMTGTGKSELLVTWVTAIARSHGPDRVAFVLADFKGGTAFEPLRALRQVAAVITDLDDEGARRGVSSLRAELRRRETLLAAAGARDVSEVRIPRLVVVVDEFAALLQEHPDLGAFFTDIAARGRALGMHLILGTQRASGVIRDALAANCPLRVGLRVVDAADSRLMLGSAVASEIPGGAESRGLGFVRRPQDAEPEALRVARTTAADLRDAALRWADGDAPHVPWLPALPSRLPLDALLAPAPEPGVVVLGRADDPERQRQPPETLRVGHDRGLVVLGAPGSGRSTALRVLASQHLDPLWVPNDREAAWDLLSAWCSGSARLAPLVLCDDLDVLVAGYPADYAQEFLRHWEQVLRTASGSTFVLTAGKAQGQLGRVFDALPRRALLRLPSRVEHLAAGGEASGYLADRPAGRARIGDLDVQVAWVDEQGTTPAVGQQPPWVPDDGMTGVVTSHPAGVVERLRAAHPDCEVTLLGEQAGRTATSTIVAGDSESWLRTPAVWQRVRASGTILVRSENPGDLRQLAGIRELPPYAEPHAGRAWSVRGDSRPRRVVVPPFAPQGVEIRQATHAETPAVDTTPASDTPTSRRALRRRGSSE